MMNLMTTQTYLVAQAQLIESPKSEDAIRGVFNSTAQPLGFNFHICISVNRAGGSLKLRSNIDVHQASDAEKVINVETGADAPSPLISADRLDNAETTSNLA